MHLCHRLRQGRRHHHDAARRRHRHLVRTTAWQPVRPLLPIPCGRRCAVRRPGAQPRHRSLLGQPDHRLQAQLHRRPERRQPEARRLGQDADTEKSRRPTRHDGLRTACAGFLDQRQHRQRRASRQVRGLHRNRLQRHEAPGRAQQGRHDRHPPAAGVRHRQRAGTRLRRAGRGRPARPETGRPGTAGAGRKNPDHRLLQLGLRPVPLQRTRRQLRHRSVGRRQAHHRIPPDGTGAAQDRPARRHGRGLQPHLHRRPAREIGAGPRGARLLPPPERQGRGRALDLLRQYRHRKPDDGQADDRLRRAMGRSIQDRLLPLRPDGATSRAPRWSSCKPAPTAPPDATST